MRRRRRHWRVIELSSFSAMFSQLPCFGVWQNSMRTNQLPCPGRLEHFVEGALRVRVEVVAHQGDLLAFGVASFQQAGDLQRPVHLRAPGPGRRLPPTRQRFATERAHRKIPVSQYGVLAGLRVQLNNGLLAP